jgi:peptide/nickel transport system substrate-binding protein
MDSPRAKKHISRRDFMQISFGTAATLLAAAACTPKTPQGAAGPAAPAPTAALAAAAPAAAAPTAAPAVTLTSSVPKKGGILKIAHTAETPNFDPASLTVHKFPILPQIFSTLTSQRIQGKPEPELAESWQYAPDKSSLEVKLRKGVKWHSGKDFTSKDVVYTMKRIADPATGAQLRNTLANVTAEAVDPLTVRFNLKAPVPALFDAFDQLYIVDEDTVGDLGRQPNGLGPFKLAEWTQGNMMRLVKNEAYWKPGKPLLDEVQIILLSDYPAMLANLEAGGVDIIEQVPNQEHERLRKNSKIQLLISDNASVTYDILYKVTTAPYDNKKVRQALSYAMDRQRFIDTVLFGVGQPKSTPWPSTSMAYVAELDKTYEFNLDKAKALLKEANVPDGIELQMLASTASWPDLIKFAQIFQADLETIGVHLKIDDAEAVRWQTTVSKGQFTQMATHAFAFAHKDPSLLFTALPFQPDTGITGFRSDEYKQLVNSGATETDPEKRKAIYKQLTQMMVDEQWISTLTPALRSWGLRSNVTGFRSTLDDYEVLEDVAFTA